MSFPNLDLNLYCDGGARGNPGPAASGFVLLDSSKKTITKGGRFLGEMTNNQAEYHAVIDALTWLLINSENIDPDSSNKISLQVYLDSELLVNQLSGKYKIKNQTLKELSHRAKTLSSNIPAIISYHHVPREQNFIADSIVNKILDAFLETQSSLI